MSLQQRVPSGAPAGGQFAQSANGETGTVLELAPPVGTRASQRSDAHSALHERGLGESKLSLLAPVEARSVLGTMPAGADRPTNRAHLDAYLHWRDLADTGELHEVRANRIVSESTRQFEASRLGFADTEAAVKAERTPVTIERAQESERDLSDAVRRMDDAIADVRYLSDPTWRATPATTTTESMNDYYARSGAQRRFAKKGYRGQVF